MSDKLFASFGFSICALFFASFTLAMYLNKKRYKNLENRLYFILLILIFALIISEFTYVIFLYNENTGPLTVLACRIWMNLLLIWQSILTYYMIVIGTRRMEDLQKRKKRLLITGIALGTIALACCIISNLLPIEFNNYNSRTYSFGGEATYTGFVLAGIAMVAAVYTLLIKKDIVSKKQKVPILFAILIISAVVVLQLVRTDLDFNYQNYESVIFLIMLFFTSESQDNKLLEEHEKQKNEAEKLNQEQTEFLTSMSHEIRTPMSAIMGLSEVILREESDDYNVVKNDMDNIHQASMALLQLINNILDLSRIDSGKETLIEKNFDIKSVLENINSLVKSNIDTQDITFTIKADNDIPSVYMGDASKITKIVTCLSVNAVYCINKGNIVLDVKIFLDENSNPILEFDIKATGEVIEHKEIPEYFDKTKKNSINTITLGISLSKQYSDMMNGTITYESNPDQFIYTFKVPLSIINNDPIGNIDILFKEINSDITKLDLSNKKILIIDDNELNIKLLARLLAEYNNTSDSAKSGEEGINKIMNQQYDLVFLDHMMPDMDGIETIRILKDKKQDLPPIIALTANTFSGAKDFYISEGFYDYLEKPINKNELYNLLFNMFNYK